jgi:small subunit ribosomal protein S6
MREYEITYLISDNVPESELNKVTGKVGGYITHADGKILKEEIWGRRKLAYPIQKQEFATYVTVNFDLPAAKAHDFERNIELTSKIIRHLLIVKDFGEEKLTLTAEDIAETKEIKEVVGSEKSFEAIEGETEESKDLMAVREKEEKKEEEKTESIEKTAEVKTKIKKEEKETPEEKPKAKKAPKKKEDEADRLSKLDKELDEILGEEL